MASPVQNMGKFYQPLILAKRKETDDTKQTQQSSTKQTLRYEGGRRGKEGKKFSASTSDRPGRPTTRMQVWQTRRCSPHWQRYRLTVLSCDCLCANHLGFENVSCTLQISLLMHKVWKLVAHTCHVITSQYEEARKTIETRPQLADQEAKE